MVETDGDVRHSTGRLNVFFPTDSDYENPNRSADVDVELMAFQSIIGDDYKGCTF